MQDGTHEPKCKRSNIFGQSCRRHSCRTLLRDTLARHFRHSAGHSCRTLFWTLVQHSCGALLRDTHVRICIFAAQVIASRITFALQSCQFFSSRKLLAALHLYCQVASSEATAVYQVASSEATTPTTCFPHYMCSTSCQFCVRPQLTRVASSEARRTRSLFPHYMCTTKYQRR